MAFLKIKKSDGSWGLVGGDPLELDETLVKSGYAADALAVGNSIAQLKTSTVLHSEPQNLTEEQKTQALTNLGVYAQDNEPTDAEVGTLWIDTDDEGGEGGSSASVALDTTLTQEGMAADAKAVGDRFVEVDSSIEGLATQEYVDTAVGNISIDTSTLVQKSGDTMEGVLVAGEVATADLLTAQVRNIYAGTVDLEAGISALPAGTIYLVYEE